jgi:hypothetical protein
MKVFCNGFPKAGNHALQKAVELLGVPCNVSHRVFEDGVPYGTTHSVFIKRDPRDIIVSWLRFQQDVVTPGKFLARFRKFDYASLCEEMAQYEGWLYAQNTHVVRYEELIKSERAMRDMAAYLGVPYIDGAWSELPGLTRTWNDVMSDHRTVWTYLVQTVWSEEGGDQLLLRWGY